MVVERHLLDLVLDRAGVRPMEVLDRSRDALALVEQPLTERVDVGDRHSPASSRRSASSAARPRSSTTLSRTPCPETSVSPVTGTESRLDRSRRTAAFARPRSGGAATLTFHASPYRPTISVRAAPGETRSRRRVVGTTMLRR